MDTAEFSDISNYRIGFVSIFVSFALLAGCGMEMGGESPDYEQTCTEIRCHNADDSRTYEDDRHQAKECTWQCTCYDGSCGQYVTLTWWKSEDGCWELDTEYVSSDGICN